MVEEGRESENVRGTGRGRTRERGVVMVRGRVREWERAMVR
jgi:hypothetical protein